MQNNKLIKYLLPGFYSALFYFFITPWQSFLVFFAGLYLGVLFLILDKKVLIKYYAENKENPEFITNSMLFKASLIPMAIFVLTSTGSLVGSGMILGIILSLVYEMRKQKHYYYALGFLLISSLLFINFL
jgi:hypothetical protein